MDDDARMWFVYVHLAKFDVFTGAQGVTRGVSYSTGINFIIQVHTFDASLHVGVV